MGTGRPHVEISAATLAGGEKNQDRYAYGDGWAFVLDGASSFATEQPEHDGGWYAEHLKQALSAGLTNHPEWATQAIVEDATRTVAEFHDGEAMSCPTSTVALARWDNEVVEVYLLGDSTAALISADGEEVLSDARLADIAQPIRDEYQSRLRAGHGFDDHHHKLLQQLQSRQVEARNRPGGYWIAGADPEAARQALTYTQPLATLQYAVLATDGAASAIRYGIVPTWAEFAGHDPEEVLRQVQEAERGDLLATRWPRSKQHDDKTGVSIAIR